MGEDKEPDNIFISDEEISSLQRSGCNEAEIDKLMYMKAVLNVAKSYHCGPSHKTKFAMWLYAHGRITDNLAPEELPYYSQPDLQVEEEPQSFEPLVAQLEVPDKSSGQVTDPGLDLPIPPEWEELVSAAGPELLEQLKKLREIFKYESEGQIFKLLQARTDYQRGWINDNTAEIDQLRAYGKFLGWYFGGSEKKHRGGFKDSTRGRALRARSTEELFPDLSLDNDPWVIEQRALESGKKAVQSAKKLQEILQAMSHRGYLLYLIEHCCFGEQTERSTDVSIDQICAEASNSLEQRYLVKKSEPHNLTKLLTDDQISRRKAEFARRLVELGKLEG